MSRNTNTLEECEDNAMRNDREQDLLNQCINDISHLKEDIQELKSLLRHTKTIDRL
jgi:peptidoglycan hydrolase CwlO-like protein